jgi:hypothetical protein
MELITILNHCHRHRRFVYEHARFGPDQKSIEVDVRLREGSAAVCSGCHQPTPGYDHLPERRFEFIPLWVWLANCYFARDSPEFQRSVTMLHCVENR